MTFNDIKLACYKDHRPAELPVNKLQSQALVRSFLPLQRSNLLLLLSALLSQLRQVLLIHLRRQQTRSNAHVEVIQTGNRHLH